MKKSWKLTEHEESVLLPLILQLLSNSDNRNIFPNPEICRYLEEQSETIVKDSQIRKLVYNIRQRNLIPILIANGDGYYTGKNIPEIKQWIKTHKGKIEAMISTLESIEDQFIQQMRNLNYEENGLTGQISIFDIID